MGIQWGHCVAIAHFQKRTLQRFNSQFTDKISNIRTTLQADLNDGNSFVKSSVDSAFEDVPLKELCTMDTATVESIINKLVKNFVNMTLCLLGF